MSPNSLLCVGHHRPFSFVPSQSVRVFFMCAHLRYTGLAKSPVEKQSRKDVTLNACGSAPHADLISLLVFVKLCNYSIFDSFVKYLLFNIRLIYFKVNLENIIVINHWRKRF